MGTFPTYTAEVLTSTYTITLCIAINNSLILDTLLQRNRIENFTIEPFKFTLRDANCFIRYIVNYVYDDASFPLQILAIDTLKVCGLIHISILSNILGNIWHR